MEGADYRGFLQNEVLASGGRPVQFADNYWEPAKGSRRSLEASSRLHPWRDAAVSLQGMRGSGRPLPWWTKHWPTKNSASPSSQSMSIQPPKRPQHTNACAVDLRNGLAVAFQERFEPFVVSNI